jgi:hypothetical protein
MAAKTPVEYDQWIRAYRLWVDLFEHVEKMDQSDPNVREMQDTLSNVQLAIFDRMDDIAPDAARDDDGAWNPPF